MLERSDIDAIGEQLLDTLIASPPEEAWRFAVRITSGTSGKPLLTVNAYENTHFEKFSDSETIVLCKGSLSVKLANLLFVRHARSPRQTRTIVLDGKDLCPGLSHLLEDFLPDTFEGVPSFIERVSNLMTHDTSEHVRLLMLSGERLVPRAAAYFTERFSHARIQMSYNATEIGLISSRGCRYLSPNTYHPLRGVEVMVRNPDKSGAGELIISKTLSSGARIEGYRIGDSGRLIDTPCLCGAPVTFEHLGRAGYDYIKLRGALIRREEFDRALRAFSNLVEDYKVEVFEVDDTEENRAKIVLHVFCRGKELGTELTVKIVSMLSHSIFLTPTKTLNDLIDEGLFSPLSIKVSSVPFPQKSKDVKLSLHA